MHVQQFLPTIFVSHGAPTLAIEPSPAREFLCGYGEDLARRYARPRAILIVSAHWETAVPTLGAAPSLGTIHDFSGFSPELYRVRYAASGSAELVERASALLAAGGFPVERDPARGLDHGAWIPLALMFPNADIPVTQLSLQTRLGPEHHWKIGEALAPLRREGVLILASGQVTHNLRELGRYREPPAHVVEFVDWLAERAQAKETDALLDYRRRAPHAERNHPTDEHLLPFFAALGAAGDEGLRRVHESVTYGSLCMDVYESAATTR